jgi:Protein of unknown function (DUF1579)
MMFDVKTIAISVIVVIASLAAQAQESADGRDHPLQDPFLDGLVGQWQVARKMPNRTAENTVQAEWVLNHQFLRLHYRDTATPPKYEAMVFIGYDNASERYVAHWIDVFGGRFSETLGYGKLDDAAHAIRFVFEYPDGPFQNTFTFDPKEKTWTSLMRQKDNAGHWSTFAEDHFRPGPAK